MDPFSLCDIALEDEAEQGVKNTCSRASHAAGQAQAPRWQVGQQTNKQGPVERRTSKEGFRSWGVVTTTPYASWCHVEVCPFWCPARRQDLLQSFFGAVTK